jgi:integrase
VEGEEAMPYQRKDSPIWWVSITNASGNRVRRSTGTEDRKEAEALEAKWKLEAHHMKQWGKKPTHTFEQLMVPYYKAVSGDLRSPERILAAVRRLKPVFEGRAIEELRRSDIAQYIEKRKADGVSNATINRELDVLSAAINHARYKWEWEITNPVERMSLKEPEGRLRWITRAEADALICEAGKEPKSLHLADFIGLALNTGCRKNEMLKLEWNRVDLKDNRLYLEGEHTKSGKRRLIPLNTEARQALLGRAHFRAQYCPASPWVFAHKNGERVQYMQNGFEAACARAGIKDFRVHDMRHTFASWLVSAGVPLVEVRDLLGHSTIEMTERYAHLAPDNHVRAVSVLDRMSRFGHADGAGGTRQVS